MVFNSDQNELSQNNELYTNNKSETQIQTSVTGSDIESLLEDLQRYKEDNLRLNENLKLNDEKRKLFEANSRLNDEK